MVPAVKYRPTKCPSRCYQHPRTLLPTEEASSVSKRIPLTQGYFTVVDDEDHEYLSQFKWRAENAHRADRFPIYATRGVRRQKNKTERESMHRLVIGAKAGELVDHIDGDSLNNTRSNLRIANATGNSRNRRKRRTPTTSKYLGVCWNKTAGKWQAGIQANKRQRFLGLFVDEDSAALAYDKAVEELNDEFKKRNFPKEVS